MTTTADVPTTRIWILVFDDCDQLDVTAPYEMLWQARRYLSERTPVKRALELTLVAVDGATAQPGLVRAWEELTFGCTPHDPQWPLPDVLIVAGGRVGQDEHGNDVGITKQMKNPAFTSLIAAQNARDGLVASVCTAAFGIVGAGVAQGRTMTTHPGLVDDISAYGVRVLNPDWQARVVDDGNLVSCGGVTSGIDEALYLIERLFPEDPQLIGDVRSFVDYLYRATIHVCAS